jgi:hypothetical protein
LTPLDDAATDKPRRSLSRKLSLGGALLALQGESREQRQLKALEALINHRLSGSPDVEGLVEWLVQDVLHPDGGRAFPFAGLREKVTELIHSDAARELEDLLQARAEENAGAAAPAKADVGSAEARPSADLVLMVFRVLAPRFQMHFGDSVGQIIYRHRKNEVFKESRLLKVAEDTTWMVPSKERGGADVHKAVEQTFNTLSRLSIERSGKLDSRQWHKVVRLIQADPALTNKVKASECDRLFYLSTHHDGEASVAVDSTEFKAMLAQLSESMQVHPYQVFKAVGKFSEPPDLQSCSSKPPTPPEAELNGVGSAIKGG